MAVSPERSPEEKAQTARLESHYLQTQAPVMLGIEQNVCGCNYGACSWTTKAEAHELARQLGLRPGLSLLDLGSGTGWPGLYLSGLSGCDLMLIDLPHHGLKIADDRARKEGLAQRVCAVVADAAGLPLADGSFDAISHSDLLCCLKQKRAVLAAARRVVRPEGCMVFTVISVTPGLTATQHDRALANGPDFVDSDTDYPTLLAATGWTLSETVDLTDAYADSCQRQLEADLEHGRDLAELIGQAEYAERLETWRSNIAALGDGLLRRHLYASVPMASFN
ncbi:MAG: class I SAM-dependent methyltransferase [Alphaproteobacteria bacterium]|jgi:SAM-dependent methyltransferase